MTTAHRPRLGFIGLGTMGAAMAANLIKAGYPLVVWNRTASRMEPLIRLGAKASKSAARVASDVDVVITMVSAPKDVEAVALGPDGVRDGITPGSVLIDMSTVSPLTSRKLAGAMTVKQAEFLDAPVVGSKGPAAEGALVILVGGLPQTVARCMPILQAMGKTIVHAGNVGSGAALKLATNLMLSHLIAGFSEGLLLTKRAGLDPNLLLQVIEASTFHSPYYKMKGAPMLRGDFNAHFALKHMRKDLDLMGGLAQELGTELPVTEAIRRLFQQAEQAGHGEHDYSAIYAHLGGVDPSISRIAAP